MNYKRYQIESFIDKELIDKIESAFAKHKDERASTINQKFGEVKEKIIQTLGSDAITSYCLCKWSECFNSAKLGDKIY